jgi:uncharacterized protein (TIGR03118 family)
MDKEFKNQFITSDVSGLAKYRDELLSSVSAITIEKKKCPIIWAVNYDTGILTSYNIKGKLLSMISVFQPLVDVSPGNFNDLVVNTIGAGFNITSVNPDTMISTTASSHILICTDNGTVLGYNASLNPSNPSLFTIAIGYDNSENNAVYTGMVLFNGQLYLTDFLNNVIIALDANFNPITLPSGAFVDGCIKNPIPEDFHVYNIKTIDDLFYVTYAFSQPNPSFSSSIPTGGTGRGYVSVFDGSGKFIRRLYSENQLDTPWGISEYDGNILIGNIGDGKILILSKKGKFLGFLKSKLINKENIKKNKENNKEICDFQQPQLYSLVNYKDDIYWCSYGINDPFPNIIGKLHQ